MAIRDELYEEFSSQLRELGTLEVGSEKYKIANDGVLKQAELIHKIDQTEADLENKQVVQDKEQELKEKQLKSDNRNKWIGYAIEGAKFVGASCIAIWGYKTNIRYEDKGLTPTTFGGKEALRSLFSFIGKNR